MEGRGRRWVKRIAGLIGTGALLAVGAAIAVMVIPSGGEEPVVDAAPAATPTPEAERKERKPKLTAAERRARRSALQTLSEQGYEPVSREDYDFDADLRVLIGRDDAGGRRAFFFAGREFVGNDSDYPSRKLSVARSGRRSVTLEYRLYEPSDRPCCPKGATVRARWRWTGDALEPQAVLPDPALRFRAG